MLLFPKLLGLVSAQNVKVLLIQSLEPIIESPVNKKFHLEV